ncbi:MAG: GIY-YIG nuclease family protein, partial [Nostoc sp.]
AYIGSTSNLRSRMYAHNKKEEFSDFRYVKIAWFECPNEAREDLEFCLINKFSPLLNKRGMPSTLNEHIDKTRLLHLDRSFISGLIEGVINDDPFDIAIAMDIGLL